MEEVVKNVLKYAEIVSVLEQNNISWNGLVDGLVETYHNDNPAQPLLTEQKQIRCTTVQIWHTAPLLYSVCYRLY
jgi:hypothetical protein